MSTFAIADTHGDLLGFADVLSKSKFKESDTLISLGDICDGGILTKDIIDILLTFPNVINIQGNHDCLTPDAEIFTKRGWLTYDKLTKNDFVFSFDILTKYGKWMPINEIIIKQYSGDMVTLNTNRCKMMVTPNHRLLCKLRKSSKNVWSNYTYIHASDMKGRIKFQSCASNNYPDYDISDDKICLSAWILTDGHITPDHGYVHIYQSKKNTIEIIKNLLNTL